MSSALIELRAQPAGLMAISEAISVTFSLFIKIRGIACTVIYSYCIYYTVALLATRLFVQYLASYLAQ